MLNEMVYHCGSNEMCITSKHFKMYLNSKHFTKKNLKGSLLTN